MSIELKKFSATVSEREALHALFQEQERLNARLGVVSKEIVARLGLDEHCKLVFDASSGTFTLLTKPELAEKKK